MIDKIGFGLLAIVVILIVLNHIFEWLWIQIFEGREIKLKKK